MWIHIILTVTTSLFMLMIPYLSTYTYGGAGGPRRYYEYGEFNKFKIFGNMTNIVVTIFALLLLVQMTFFVNLLVGLYKGVGRQNNL